MNFKISQTIIKYEKSSHRLVTSDVRMYKDDEMNDGLAQFLQFFNTDESCKIKISVDGGVS